MTHDPVTRERLDAEIRRRLESGQNKRAIMRDLGCSHRTVQLVARAMGGTPKPVETVTREGNDSEQKVEYRTRQPIHTLEQALAHAEVDTSVWRVKRWWVTSGEVGMKLVGRRDGKIVDETPHVQPVFWVRLELERIVPKAYTDAIEGIFARYANDSPKWPALVSRGLKTDPAHLIEFDLFDAHFGKLAWAAECGKDYDLKIAERIYRNAVEDLMDLASPYKAAKILIPIGNDFYHIDNLSSSTTGGTLVDSDGRYPKIIETGEVAVIEAIRLLATVAPVSVTWVPGNHDRLASYHLMRSIHWAFSGSDRVTVDTGRATRKYVRFGTCLLGYIHGDKIKPDKLHGLMSQEQPKAWAETTCHEWKRGHDHTTKQHKTEIPVDSYKGTVVRTLSALCYTDGWCFDNGYVGSRSAAECYLYHHDAGYRGHFAVDARE